MKTKPSRVQVGREGEDFAAQYLLKMGWELIERNFRTREGEIDIIAREDNTLVFVEVKSNRQQRFGPPELRVDERKQRQIARTAEQYLYSRQIVDMDCRFDVITVDLAQQPPQIKHIENAFWLEE